MILPDYILRCIDRLEQAGFAAYAVGGCVRDALLGLTPHDYDLTTSATPEQIKAVFSDHRQVHAGEKHGTISVLTEGGLVEITAFRTEGGYQDNRHPDWVKFVDRIEDDLARRDFTVNAMAYSPSRGFADPWDGRQDLKSKTLRAVGDPATRFREDSLRILRGVRFAVRYGLTPEKETEHAMLNQAHLMDNLAQERIFDELCKLLPLVSAQDLLRFAPIIVQVIPELRPAIGFDQRSPHHAYDIFTHIAHVTAAVPPELPLRLAALLHDVGKTAAFTLDENGRGHFKGHAKIGAEIANAILLRLKAPTALREQVVNLVARHMTPLEPDKRILRRRLGQYGIDGTRQLLALQQADFGSKGTGLEDESPAFAEISRLIDEIQAEDACLTVKDLAIDGKDLIGLGFAPGKTLGACLEHLLQMVQDERIPNTREALLRDAESFLIRQ